MVTRSTEKLENWQRQYLWRRRMARSGNKSAKGPGLLTIAAHFLAACLLLTIMLSTVYVIAALMGADSTPTERCFNNHLSGEKYCRSQTNWGNK